MVKEKAHKHGISFQIHINDLPSANHADERKFKQILYNLLSNAVKFTPDGGAVTLAAKRVEGEAGSVGEDQGSVFHCRLPVRPLRNDHSPRRNSRPSSREPLTHALGPG